MASILVIDDHGGAHELITSALSLAGHDVAVRRTAELEGGRYDVALVADETALPAARRHSRRVMRLPQHRTPRLILDSVNGLLSAAQSPSTSR